MTHKTTAADADDPDDPAFAGDVTARAESDWLLARERDPGARPPSPEIARHHAEIEQLLADLPLGPSDDSWHDEVLRAAAAATQPPAPPWWRTAAARWAFGGGLAVAAAAVFWAMLPAPAPAEELEVAIRPGSSTRGGSTRADLKEAVVGDHLVVTARPHEPAELRVFRADGTQVAKCPGGPGCQSAAQGEYAIDISLDAPVQYHVILVVGSPGAPAGATMDAYMYAARAAKARIVPYPPIDVH